MLRHKLNSLPLGSKEAPVEVEILGSQSLQQFAKALQEAYKEAGPRFGVIPTPLYKQLERHRRRGLGRKAGASNEGAGGDAGPGGAAERQRVALFRPVVIKRDASMKANAVVDLGSAVLVVKGPGISIEGVDFTGFGRSGLGWGETHGMVEVCNGGDLVMKSCNLVMKTPILTKTEAAAAAAKAALEDAGSKEPSPKVPLKPSKDCSVFLVHDGGRATLDACSLKGSPCSYGLVARGSGTKMLLEGCLISSNMCSNVMACEGASLSLLPGCQVLDSVEGYGLAVTDRRTSVYCQDVVFSGNSRDNVLCTSGARVVLEGCTMLESKLRSGLRVDGEGSIAIARDSRMEGNVEHAVRASWGAWASVRGCRYSGHHEDGLSESLVEGPEATLVQDPSQGRAAWRYLSSMERPWSSMNRTTTLVVD